MTKVQLYLVSRWQHGATTPRKAWPNWANKYNARKLGQMLAAEIEHAGLRSVNC